ncbi:MAG: TRAM domain-containing protein, partial [Geminicoccaceae bacterium]
MIGRTVEVAIETIGANGDGVGHVDGMPVYVDQGLPGDALTVRLCAGRGQGYAAETVEARTLMPRRMPICGHFGMCGGCRLQHLSTPDYRRWKEQRIEAALASRGIDKVEIKPLIDGSPASRRRLRLAFRSKGKGIVLGFRKRLGQEVVAIEECPIACEEIVNIFKPLQHHLGSLDMAARGGEVTITSADNGLDLLIETPISPNLADREALAGLANTEDLARLSWRENPRAPIEPISV